MKTILAVFLLCMSFASDAQTFPVQNLQVNGSITSYLGVATAGSGAAVEYSTVDATGQTSSIATTTAYTASLSGVYLIVVDMVCTTAGTGSVNASIGWNNGSAGVSGSTGNMSLTVLGNESTQTYIAYVPAGQSITYGTTVNGTIGSATYSVRVRILYFG